jgi:hypothetical protein
MKRKLKLKVQVRWRCLAASLHPDVTMMSAVYGAELCPTRTLATATEHKQQDLFCHIISDLPLLGQWAVSFMARASGRL